MINLTVFGEPASKSNCRKIVWVRPKRCRRIRPMVIKSEKALQYEKDFLAQVVRPKKPLEGDLILHCTIFYRTNRPDLDESLVMDCLQKAGIIGNDRQIKEKHIYHGGIQKENPRVEIRLGQCR